MTTLIKNCRLISPGVDLYGASILLDGGVVRRICERGADLPAADQVHDARGHMAMPGFVDIHFHGAMGCDVTDGTLDAMERIAEAKLREGVTTMVPTTLTLPEEKLERAMGAVAEYAERAPFAKVAGVHLEGPFINPGCTGAQNPDFVRRPDLEEVLRLNAITRVAIVTFAVEMEGGLELARGLAEAGIVPSCGHSAATYATFREAKAAGVRHLTHFCNQMTGLHHREIGLVGAGILDDDILIEMICDGIHLCPDMIRLAFKVKSSDRIALIADAICATGLADGAYTLGGLAVKVEEGAARLVSSGALAGSTLRYNHGLRNVHRITRLPLSELVKTTSLNQARSLGLEKTGKIEEGYGADLVILDDDFEVEAVFVDGDRRL